MAYLHVYIPVVLILSLYHDAHISPFLPLSLSPSPPRYVYCPKCFSEITSDKVTVGDDPLTATVIMKSVFKEMKNDSIDREPMTACIHCGRRMHTICVLHMDQIYHGGFQCDNCLGIKCQTRKENKFSAKSE
jgi:E1A/CREB-binding protein